MNTRLDYHKLNVFFAYHMFYGVDEADNPAPSPSYARIAYFSTNRDAVKFAVDNNIVDYHLQHLEL